MASASSSRQMRSGRCWRPPQISITRSFSPRCSGRACSWARILVVERRASPASETDGVTGRHTGRLLIVFILWLAFAFSLLLGAAGYMQLARLIGDGALESTYAALAILIGVWVLLVLFAYALWARPLGLLESVQRNRAFLERRAGQVLRGVGGAAWVLISLRPLTLFSAPAGLVRAALGAGFAWGSIRITVGDVPALRGDGMGGICPGRDRPGGPASGRLLPRVRLAEGVPLALANLAQYAIVLAGFILGLAALGVDLTKVTILVELLVSASGSDCRRSSEFRLGAHPAVRAAHPGRRFRPGGGRPGSGPPHRDPGHRGPNREGRERLRAERASADGEDHELDVHGPHAPDRPPGQRRL